jgi:hypothetical protein
VCAAEEAAKMHGTDLLPSWNDGAARYAVLDFVRHVTTAGGPEFVPERERIAVFDNDGTLWCEKPIPIELGFILQRLAAMAEKDASLRDQQPWKAAVERDYRWLGGAVTRHYEGDDSDVKVLMGGILKAFRGWTVEAYEGAAEKFLHDTTHPSLRRAFCDCG